MLNKVIFTNLFAILALNVNSEATPIAPKVPFIAQIDMSIFKTQSSVLSGTQLKLLSNDSGRSQRVRNIIIDVLGVDPSAVVMSASFVDDLGADSLDLVTIKMNIEKEFNLVISDESAETITTVGGLIVYVAVKATN